jgi:hypothetical protein
MRMKNKKCSKLNITGESFTGATFLTLIITETRFQFTVQQYLHGAKMLYVAMLEQNEQITTSPLSSLSL